MDPFKGCSGSSMPFSAGGVREETNTHLSSRDEAIDVVERQIGQLSLKELPDEMAVTTLSLQPVMETIRRYLPNPVALMGTCTRVKKAVHDSFSREFVESRAERMRMSVWFSLVSAPLICRENRIVALSAMQKNGLEYNLLSPELQRDASVIKLALLSVLNGQADKLVRASERDSRGHS